MAEGCDCQDIGEILCRFRLCNKSLAEATALVLEAALNKSHGNDLTPKAIAGDLGKPYGWNPLLFSSRTISRFLVASMCCQSNWGTSQTGGEDRSTGLLQWGFLDNQSQHRTACGTPSHVDKATIHSWPMLTFHTSDTQCLPAKM